jgi:nicotinamidase-related amidase
MSSALVLIDFENEWITKGSEYCVGDISYVIKKTNKLIDFCRKNKYKIIFTTHVEKDSKDAFSGKRTEIISNLHRQKNDVLIKKNKISPFYNTTLDEELKDVKNVIVCGILTNLCVRSFVQDAYDRDFSITIIKDCCVAFNKKTQEFTFNDLKATREEIEIKSAEGFIKK